MNTNTLYATCLFAALNMCTFSARAEADVTPQTYLNSQGKTEILNYRKFAECHSDN